ncbi:hypothetical protein IWQ55_006402 [Labrenzia sp. EL_208]|nr:hypothetical protein [Labrenzia sp. EL_132]MBG6233167.1 hypothetical protein [Labrenzia sp. EL_208]
MSSQDNDMTTLVERAADLLFPEEGPRTLNVKIHSDGNLSMNNLAEQIVRAEAQIRSGTARLVRKIDCDS